MKQLLLATALSLAAGAASAAPETYAIDTGHTRPTFSISHLGFSTFRGRFDGTSGTITLDLEKKTAAADVSIDVAGVSTGVAKLDEHLKSADFFDAAKYPTITFKSTESKFKGDRLVALSGDLTMHGMTKPVKLKVHSFKCMPHPMMKVPTCGADASLKIKRSDWGITMFAPALGDEVTLEIEVEAQQKPDLKRGAG